MNNVPPDLTILILCRNEEKSITNCVDDARGFLERNAISGEVLVVDNDSRDRSAVLAEEAGARVVRELRRGYGNAIIAGIAAAHGRFIILGDGDGEHDLSALEPFWEALQGGHDFVIGNRFAGRADPGAMRFLNRYVGAPLLSGLGRLLFPSPVRDYHCGLRGFSAARVRTLGLQSPGMECASEMIIKAVRKNMRIAQVPVKQRPALDPERTPHLRIWRDGWRHLRLLLMLSPHWLFLYPGCLLLAVGVVLMTVPILHPVEAGGGFGAYTMLFGSGFIVCGTQLIGFALAAGLFGESIGLTDGRWSARVLRYHVLEQALAVGGALALAGAAGGVWSVFVWSQTGAGGVLDVEMRLRVAIPSVTVLIVAVEVMFSGFLLTLLASQRFVSNPLPDDNPARQGEMT